MFPERIPHYLSKFNDYVDFDDRFACLHADKRWHLAPRLNEDLVSMTQPIMQSLWIGPRLSVMEQLSIRSYLALGYAFHLYTYESVENIPAGVEVRMAAEILGPEEIFCYQNGPGKGSHAAFANGFRYKLLLERGGWWTDLDSICLRPLDFADDHVLGLEHEPDGSQCVAVGLVKAPPGSPVMEKCWDACRRANRSQLVWGQIGPRLMNQAIRAVDVPVRILDPIAFYPINYWQHGKLIRGGRISAESYAIHLWHARWTRPGPWISMPSIRRVRSRAAQAAFRRFLAVRRGPRAELDVSRRCPAATNSKPCAADSNPPCGTSRPRCDERHPWAWRVRPPSRIQRLKPWRSSDVIARWAATFVLCREVALIVSNYEKPRHLRLCSPRLRRSEASPGDSNWSLPTTARPTNRSRSSRSLPSGLVFLSH